MSETTKPKTRKKYGLNFPIGFNSLDIELYCFKVARTVEQGGLGKEEHFWRAVGMLWGPNNVVKNKSKIFIRNPWSEEIISDFCEYRYVGVGGCAGSTKSETAALWLLINFLANPRNTLCIALSTSLKEARKRIWGSLVDFVRAIPAPGLPLKVVDSMGVIRYDSPTFTSSDKSTIALVAAERSQATEAIGKLIGMHNHNVIVVADELSELTPSILEYALPGGNLSSNPVYQFIGLSNPVSYYDPFGVIWKPLAGWASITVEDTRWVTQYGIAIHFDGTKSPNIAAGRVLYPFLPTAQKIEDAEKAEGGRTSLRFWRMIRGFFAPVGSEDLIYSEAEIIKYKGDEVPTWNEEPLIQLAALDPSFTQNGDRAMVKFGVLGTTVEGVRCLCYTGEKELVEDVTLAEEERAFQISRQFRDLCVSKGLPAYNTATDATGAGAPFCDVLATVWERSFLRTNFGGKASDLQVSLVNPKMGYEVYYDRVSEIWYSGKELLRQGQLKGITPTQAREMATRHYGTIGATKKIYVESKKDMKGRTKMSPDNADAGFILLDLARQRFGFMAALTAEEVQTRKGSRWRDVAARAMRMGPKLNMPTNLP